MGQNPKFGERRVQMRRGTSALEQRELPGFLGSSSIRPPFPRAPGRTASASPGRTQAAPFAAPKRSNPRRRDDASMLACGVQWHEREHRSQAPHGAGRNRIAGEAQ